MKSKLIGAAFALVFAVATTAFPSPESDPDSLRAQIGNLSAQGKLDAALALVDEVDSALPPSVADLLKGKLELVGEASRKAYDAAAKDTAAEAAVRGEALFRLGQFFYGAGKQHLAIPEFREYLSRYPTGAWAAPAAYWMGYACLQFAQRRPEKSAYLDTGEKYVTHLEIASRPNAYYLPLALALKARLLLAKKDTAAALALLPEAREKAPVEEEPGVLLLLNWASETLPPHAAMAWEDSLRQQFPSAPEMHAVKRGIARPKVLTASQVRTVPAHALREPDSITAPKPQHVTLQLGAFSRSANAEQLRLRLAAKGLKAFTQESSSGEKRVYRVLYGDFGSAEAAQKEGDRTLRPLGYVFQVSPRP